MTKANPPRDFSKKHLARIERENIQRRYLVGGAVAVLVLVVGVLLWGLLDQFVLQSRKPVAEVNGQKITIKEFQAQTRFARWQLLQQYNSTLQMYQMFGSNPDFAQTIQNNLIQIANQLNAENASVLAGTVVDQMIDDRLIEQKAKELNITVSDDEIENELQQAFGFYANGTPAPSPTPTFVFTPTTNPTQLAILGPSPVPSITPPVVETAIATVAPTEAPTLAPSPSPEAPEATPTPLPTSTPYTLEGYKTRVAEYTTLLQTSADLTEADLRTVIRYQLLRQKVFEALTKDLKPEEEQVWARHILVTDETIAKVVRERIIKGENWNTVAAEVSQDTSNKDIGGDLGWFGRGAMVTEFENAAFAMQPGEISEPVQTSFGYHIIQLVDRGMRPLDENGFASLKQRHFSQWLEEAKAADTIKRYDLPEDIIPTEPSLNPQTT